MYWAAKLARFVKLEKEARLPAKFSGPGATEQVRSVLVNNPAIRGNISLANEILESGKVVYYRKGETIIEQGGTDNEVYFLLAGTVDVIFKSQLGSRRTAPNQIGEMAAIKLGQLRSATIVAATDEVAALQISGVSFHHIWESNNEFRNSLQLEMDSRHRERIQAGEVAKKNNSLSWFMASSGLAIIGGVTSWSFFAPQEWTDTARAALSAMIGLGLFLFALLHNPAFFWRRSAGLVLLAMIGVLSLDHLIAFEAIEGFGSLSIDVQSKGTDKSGVSSVFETVGFVVVFIVCAVMDRNQNR